MVKKKRLPSKRVIIAKVNELLNAKDYNKAAELMFAYTIARMDPEEFARKLVEAADKWIKEHPKGVA